MRHAILILLVLASSLARAEPISYGGATVKLGGWSGVGYGAMLALDGGTRIDGPLWAHAEVGYGGGRSDEARGRVSQVRLGGELRSCTAPGTWCGIAGLDLGGYRAVTSDSNLTALVAVPRVGLDVGSPNVRFRIGFELEVALLDHDAWPDATTRSALLEGVGIAASAGVAYQWR